MTARFVLIGGNRRNEDGPMLDMAIELRRRGYDVVILSEKLHLDMHIADGQTLASALGGIGLPVARLDHIGVEHVRQLINENTWGLLLNAIWRIPQDVIDLFGGRLFNYHNARLPQERGAAAYTWKILRNDRGGSLTIHDVSFEFDRGDLRLVREIAFPENCRTQAQMYAHMRPLELQFLIDWAAHCAAGTEIVRTTQNETVSSYWPRLNTRANGWINWSWSVEEVARFITAFDDPHEGASTLLGDARVHLKGANFSDTDGNFHPFQAGIAFRRLNGRLYIAARGGTLTVSSILDETGQDKLLKLRLGCRFHTPQAVLDAALAARPVHTPAGIEIK